jgi:hypothetical protein
MTHDQFLRASTRKRAAWLRNLACQAMTEKRVKKLEIEWLMNGNTQILRYQRGPADVTVIWWEDFETKNKFIANYRSNSQIIICASLGALSALYHTWPEEIEFVGDIVYGEDND